ncbi:MAG TPA: glycosyltransferase family 4 protein [Symbiobacteriaceae bacterium]|jgi:glycosyltransferase involved in cell wall biosynthesis|nr:glycosyltransferase family 4 protein [Symbiobacteriaceae bacterium]
MQLRVCHISSAHPAFDVRVFYKEARYLARQYETYLVIPHTQDEVVDGVSIQHVRHRRGMLGRIRNYPAILRRALATKADVYHFHDPDLLPVGVLLRWVTRKPVVYDVHEHFPDRLFHTLKRLSWWHRLVRGLATRAENTFARWVKNIVVVENAQFERFSHLNCTVVHARNYPSLADYPEPPVDMHLRPYDLIFHGTLSEAKGSLLLVDIVAAVAKARPDVRALVVDRFFRESERAKFLERISLTDTEKNITLVPNIAASRLKEYISQARIGLSPLQRVSQYEKAIPTKFFEYMACGVTIVASDLPYSYEFVERPGCGVVVLSDTAQAYAEATCRLLDDLDMATRMGHRGRELFLSTYNWDHEFEALQTLYSQICRR